jgi:hypothetical protein
MSDPTSDPNFSGVKQPTFDALVDNHEYAGKSLKVLQYELWRQLVRLGVDWSSADRIRRLGTLVESEAADLRRRQAFVKNMDKPGGSPAIQTPKGTYWRIPVGRSGGNPDLSYELNGAEHLPFPNVDPGGTRFSPAQDAVLSWIEIHRDAILREAKARGIPPEAITSAIAWEALNNNKLPFEWPIPPGTRFGINFGVPPGAPPQMPPWEFGKDVGRRGTGPGKVHVDGELVEQLEKLGYVPPVSMAERDRILSTPDGAIKYIAAAMRAFADVTDQYGKDHPENKKVPNIRNDILMLTHLYHGEDLESWRRRLERRNWSTQPLPKNLMPQWVHDNPDYLAAMREALHGTAPLPQPETWLPPGASPTPPGMSAPPPAPSAPAPTPGLSPSPGH